MSLTQTQVTWGSKNELILVKTNKEDGTEITVARHLKGGGKVIVMVSQTIRGWWMGLELGELGS